MRQVYLRTIDDVRQKLKGDQHDIVMASGLLRKLLLDGGSSLVDQLNRNHRRRLTYEVISPTALPAGLPTPDLHFQNIDPSWLAPNAGPKRDKVSRDGLLKLKCLSISATHFSVREIIKLCAHVFGGVHLVPPTAREQILIDHQGLLFDGSSAAIHSLAGIINVIVAGLAPLTESVEAEIKRDAGAQ